MSGNSLKEVAVVGGGPAGLMVADILCAAGVTVDLYDAMPSLGRKFLMAGKSGLNLTHAEPFGDFVTRFKPDNARLHTMIEAFPPSAIQAWSQDLGVSTFTGTSGRVFPHEMKAAPLLRAWLRRLRGQGLRIHVRHRWLGWTTDGALRFDTPNGEIMRWPTKTILALGGASWPRLGSDAAWASWLESRGVEIAAFRPSNVGFEIAWSEHLLARHEGQPLKGVALHFEGRTAKGDCVITANGIEGGPVYTLSAPLVDEIARRGSATLSLDLTPDLDPPALTSRLNKPRGKTSLANHLRKTVGLSGAKAALLFEDAGARNAADPAILAGRIKAIPLQLLRPRPIAEAISSAGGVPWGAVTDDLELRAIPGVHVVGEMLDWDAPTGGYLLTGCFASGRWAGEAIVRQLLDENNLD